MTAASVMFMVRSPRAVRRITAHRVDAHRVQIKTDTSEDTYLSVQIDASPLVVAEHLEHLAAQLRRQYRHADGTAAEPSPVAPTPGPLLAVDQDRVESSPTGSPVRPLQHP